MGQARFVTISEEVDHVSIYTRLNKKEIRKAAQRILERDCIVWHTIVKYRTYRTSELQSENDRKAAKVRKDMGREWCMRVVIRSLTSI